MKKCPTIDTFYKIANGLKIYLHKLLDINSHTDAEGTDSFHNIKSALKGLNTDEMIKVAHIAEQVTELMHNYS